MCVHSKIFALKFAPEPVKKPSMYERVSFCVLINVNSYLQCSTSSPS